VIAALVLAAGASRRMGSPKMLLPLPGGKTVLRSCVDPLLEAGLERVVVVLGCEAARVRSEAGLPEDPRLSVVVNERWREGMSASLARGIEACADAEAALVALGDQPSLTASRVRRILEAYRPGARLVVPAADGVSSHPVLFSRALFQELRALSGDAGAREVIRAHWNEAVQVPLEALEDVDTPEDYGRIAGSSGDVLP